MILEAIKLVGGLIVDPLKRYQEKKRAKQDAEVRVAEAKTQALIRRLETSQQADIAWENTSISNASWKDEFWTLVLAIPLIMCFMPVLVDYVVAGFAALEQTPEWYRWAVGIAISSAFGYKKFADFMALKKGD